MSSEEFCREPGSGLLVWEGPQECGGGWWKWTFLGYLCYKGLGSGVPAPGPVQAGRWGPAFSRDESPPWRALLGQTRVQVCPGLCDFAQMPGHDILACEVGQQSCHLLGWGGGG